MKRRISILITIFILCAIPAWAIYQSSTFGNRSGIAAVGGCSCAGSFCWDVEDGTNACIGGSPVAGSETGNGTVVGSPVHGGSYAYDTVDTASYIQWTNTNNDKIDGSEGEIIFYPSTQTISNYDTYFEYYVDANNWILVQQYASDFQAIYRTGGNSNYCTAPDNDEVSSAYIKVRFTWSSTGAYLYIADVLRASDESIGTWAGNSGTITFGAISTGANGCDFVLDDVYIDKTQAASLDIMNAIKYALLDIVKNKQKTIVLKLN